MLSPHIDAQIVGVFLKELAKQIDPDVHVVLIWDQAGFHRAAALRVPDSITLLPLPRTRLNSIRSKTYGTIYDPITGPTGSIPNGKIWSSPLVRHGSRLVSMPNS